MAGGKKAKRGGTAKNKHASPPIERHTAFIESSGGLERVLPREVRKTIYRYLLLGRNVKKQRGSELWNTKGFADHYQFEVNLLRANKAIYTEGMCQYDNPVRITASLLTCTSERDSLWREHVRRLVDQRARYLASPESPCSPDRV